jgi:Family of unknown function (DUF6188)
MYRFPENFRPDTFIGIKLELICVASHHVTLHFQNRIKLKIESSIQVVTDDKLEIAYDGDTALINGMIFSCIEEEIIRFAISHTQDIEIEFQNGIVLRVKSDKDFESFQIHTDQHSIVI